MTGGAAGRRDESVTFSLRELQELEDERLAREKRDVKEREAATARAREESARREAEQIAANERADAEAREAERRRELEDMARREAMQKAIVEQARIEVDAKTRAQEAERERQHELELARLRAEQGKSKPGVVIGASLGSAGLVLIGAFAIQLGVLKPSTDARIAAITEMAARAEAHASDAERRFETEKSKVDALQKELDKAREAKPSEPSKSNTTPSKPNRGPTTTPTPTTPTPPKRTGCNPKDPMCFDPP